LKITYFSSFSLCKAARKRHEAFESDLAAQQDRVEQIVAIAQELNTLGYSKVDEINARCKNVCDGWDNLGDLTTSRNQNLASAIEIAERLDNLWLDYAKKASPFNNWMDGAKEDLMDMFNVHSLEEVQDLKDAQEQFKANMPAAQEEFESIIALQNAITGMSNQTNPYTNTKAEVSLLFFHYFHFIHFFIKKPDRKKLEALAEVTSSRYVYEVNLKNGNFQQGHY